MDTYEGVVRDQLHGPAGLPPGTHFIGDWVDPRVGHEKKKIPAPRIETRASSP